MEQGRMPGPGPPSEASTRAATGVPGLDTVLHGGLIPGTVYIVRGPPGVGKTVLANQLSFHNAGRGKRSLYVTLLSESADRLLMQLEGMAFYDPDQVPGFVYYESGFGTLDKEGLPGILRLLVTEGKAHGASFIVLDGLFVLAEHLECEREFRPFVSNLSSLAQVTGSTVLLLTNSKRSSDSPEYTMVDGWIELGTDQIEYQTVRHLEICKLRGGDFIPGRHLFTISGAGLRVLPRLESCVGRDRIEVGRPRLLPTGIAGFDRMIGGGLRDRSTTLVAGPTGIGKTSFGLHFVSQSSPEEPGLVFGFYESEEDLLEKSGTLAIDLERLSRTQAVTLVWHPPTEYLLDDLGYSLLEAVQRHRVRRLFVDGVEAFRQSVLFPARLGRFLAALTNALRARGVTSVYTLEVPELVGGEMHVQFTPVSPLAQNIVLLRYIELESEVRRSLAVIKTRQSRFDPTVREFSIHDDGIRIGRAFGRNEDGRAHPPPSRPPGDAE